METINRQRVQTSFQRGAGDYDQHTPVQKQVLQKLMCQLEQPPLASSARVLDIGCGTGRLLELVGQRFPDAALTGLDLASNMLTLAAERLPATVKLIQGDAEQLPFSADTFSLVLSSSTFQWLHQLKPCFEEVLRVLNPEGSFLFSLFGGKTLFELRESWQQALVNCGRTSDTQQDRTHRFHTCEQVENALEKAGFCVGRVWSELELVWYPDVPHLLRAIKRIGAGTAQPPSGGGLGWRRVVHEMAHIYTERFAVEGRVPVSYEVIYAAGRR